MKRVLINVLLSLTMTGLPLAASAMTPEEVASFAIQNQGKTTFNGKRIHKLVRQDLSLKAVMKIAYRDSSNYKVSILEPGSMAGMNLWLDDNKASLLFNTENLMFRNDGPVGSYEAASTIFGNITPDIQLLKNNYRMELQESDVVALYPCYVLKLTPKKGYFTPGHRFWINKENGQIMKEQRTWGDDLEPYFTSYYEDYSTAKSVDTTVNPPAGVHAVDLKAREKNSLIMHRTIADAEAAVGGKVALPTYIPDGFVLHNIQFASFFGTRITLLNYTDGLNWLFISYRPKPNMFVTMMAGAFALSLIDKMNQLSFQAPYNYYGAEKNNNLIFSYGDLYPYDLKRVGESIVVTGASK